MLETIGICVAILAAGIYFIGANVTTDKKDEE